MRRWEREGTESDALLTTPTSMSSPVGEGAVISSTEETWALIMSRRATDVIWRRAEESTIRTKEGGKKPGIVDYE